MTKKLYIKPFIPITSLEDVIGCLFSRLHPQSGNVISYDYASTTYSDRDCTEVECRAQRRSFEDLLCLARTYFPDTTELDLMRVLKYNGISCRYCWDIRKMVFMFYPLYPLTRLGDLFASSGYAENTYTQEKLQELYNQV